MFGLGLSELLIILLLVMFFYGGKRLPQIGESLGKMISEFKKSSRNNSESNIMVTKSKDELARESFPEQRNHE